MKEQIFDIAQKLYQNELKPETATNLILRLFEVKRTDAPKCTKCGAEEDKQSCLGKWGDGEEYRCDDCGNVWEFNHFEYI